jgi:hypothetical protein
VQADGCNIPIRQQKGLTKIGNDADPYPTDTARLSAYCTGAQQSNTAVQFSKILLHLCNKQSAASNSIFVYDPYVHCAQFLRKNHQPVPPVCNETLPQPVKPFIHSSVICQTTGPQPLPN